MNHSRGNALFMILIAVALFAALSYALTQSGRGGASINKETARTYASLLLQQSAQISSSLQRMKILYGCSENKFNLYTDNYVNNAGNPINYPNSKANTDGTCDLYSANGGGMAALTISEAAFDMEHPDVLNISGKPTAWRPGHLKFDVGQIAGLGTDGPSGTASANDLMIHVNYLNKDTCRAVNELAGVNNPDGDPPVITLNGATSPYDEGTFNGTAIWQGYPVSCRTAGASPPVYQYTFVLLER